MNDYSALTKEELIDRLRRLEKSSAEFRRSQESENSAARHLAESALRDSEKRIRAIVDTAVEGIITIDHRAQIQSANPAVEKMFGYSAAEIIGQNVSVLMPSPYQEAHDGYVANYLKTRQAHIIGIGREVVGRHRDGHVFPMYISVGEARLESGTFFTGILRDITRQKEAEQKLAELARTLSEKNKELETIVYVASHDLRSPLVNIQGFSKELARTCGKLQSLFNNPESARDHFTAIQTLLDEEIPEAMAYIQAGVNKIDSLLSGFLRFSRLGRAALRIECIRMESLVSSILHAMEFQIKKAEATLRVGHLPDCMGDSTQVNQVFSNLVDNALKYLDPARPGRIEIEGRSENGQSIYSVADNGIGIEVHHQQQIFEIFHRLNPSASEGEGLGLTIAQRILERHGGKIWLESVPSQGSIFYVALPRPV